MSGREETEIRRRLLAKGYRDIHITVDPGDSTRGDRYLVAIPNEERPEERQLTGTYAEVLHQIGQLPQR